MGGLTKWSVITVILACTQIATGVELTFELLDNAKNCFYEDIQLNTSCTLEYQVMTGGLYDVDVMLEDPTQEIVYRQVKLQYDSHTFTAMKSGTYIVCFSNEFSIFSHKLIYMNFQVGDEPPLPGLGEHPTVMTAQKEASAMEIHKALNSIIDYQTHNRLREAQSRKRAEHLDDDRFWFLWSMMGTLVILTVTVGQVLILKNFFSDKRPLTSQYVKHVIIRLI